MTVSTNDPQHPVLTVPVSLVLEGTPEAVVSDTCLAFGSILQFSSKTDSLTIFNKGCDTLCINDIFSAGQAFITDVTQLSIPPFFSKQVNITFQPTSIGNYTDTLWISSNAGLLSVCLSGEGTPIPFIISSPAALSDSLTCETAGMQDLVIKNTGIIPLAYTFETPAEPWIEIIPSSGLLFTGDSTIHLVVYSKTALTVGIHTADLVISSNDPLHNPFIVTLTLDVKNAYHPADLGPDQDLCEGMTAVLDPGQGYSGYVWNDGSTDSTLAVTSEGTYSVSVEDAFGCVFSDTVTVHYFDYPIVDTGPDTTLCQGYLLELIPSIQNLFPVSPAIVQMGNGTAYTSDTGPSPFGTNYMDDRTQMLYTGEEFATVGLSTGMISAIAINVGSTGLTSMAGFSIKMGHTAQNVLTGFIAGNTLVYSHPSFSPETGWNIFTLDDPFYWNGSDNVVVEVCFNNNFCSVSSSIQYSEADSCCWSGWCNNCSPGCNISGGHSFSQRANIRFYSDGDATRYTWTGPGGYLSHLRNVVIQNFNYANAGLYVLHVDNGIGCTDSDTVIVAVIPGPTANAGSDSTIVYGDTVMLSATASGGIPPYTFNWTPSAALSNPDISNPVATPPATTTYTVRVTAQNNCSDDDEVIITVLPIYHIDGTVTYNNSLSTPLNELTVYLKGPGDIVIDTGITSGTGGYFFDGLINNTYTYSVETTKPWGGVNATDALQVAKHIVYLIALTDVNLTAADVNNSGVITSADPMLILRRTVGAITSFAAGDWAFQSNAIVVNNSNITHNIRGLCYGDVNGSFIPGAKVSETISLEENGSVSMSTDGTLDIPVRTAQDLMLGAITFYAFLSEDIEEVIEIERPVEGLEWNLNKDRLLSIAWQSVEGASYKAGDSIFMLKFRLKENPSLVKPLLALAPGSEFADVNASVIAPLTLYAPATVRMPEEKECSLMAIPNPFNKGASLVYRLQEEGHISLVLYDTYGRLLQQLVSEYAIPGTYSLDLKGEYLPAGMYQLELRQETKYKLLRENLRIVKTQ